MYIYSNLCRAVDQLGAASTVKHEALKFRGQNLIRSIRRMQVVEENVIVWIVLWRAIEAIRSREIEEGLEKVVRREDVDAGSISPLFNQHGGLQSLQTVVGERHCFDKSSRADCIAKQGEILQRRIFHSTNRRIPCE